MRYAPYLNREFFLVLIASEQFDPLCMGQEMTYLVQRYMMVLLDHSAIIFYHRDIVCSIFQHCRGYFTSVWQVVHCVTIPSAYCAKKLTMV